MVPGAAVTTGTRTVIPKLVIVVSTTFVNTGVATKTLRTVVGGTFANTSVGTEMLKTVVGTVIDWTDIAVDVTFRGTTF